MRKNYSTGLLTAALAIIMTVSVPLPALAAGGKGGKGAGIASGAGSAGTTNTTTAGGGGGVGTLENFSGTVGGSGGGGAGSTGGDGGQSLILIAVGCCAIATSPNGGAGTGGATPGASGGNGADGSDITRTTGGGGGGGAHGTVLTTSTTDTGTTGGNGGNGGIGGFTMGGGGGGAAGYGVVIDGVGLSYTNTGTVAGGTGGAGGDASHFGGGNGNGGNGGDGGVGVYFTGSGMLNNSGSITGGAGGAGGSAVLAGGTNGAAGADGAGVVGSDLSIVNSGSITGGGTANAITFTGGTNSLTLEAGSTITGNVDATLGIANTLALGGATNSSFNIGSVGAAQQYRGFNTLAKTGSATWTITGNNTSGLGWNVDAGLLILNGTDSASGTTTINGGTLEVGDATHSGASIISNVTVGSGGTLRGHGTITGSVANSGSLRPGGSIGTLTVNGGVTFNSGSSFDVDVSPVTASLLNVTGAPGTATINAGATVNVLAAAGNYNLATQYTILSASGGVGGTFTSVNSNLAFLTPSLSYDANNVYLTLALNSTNFAAVATTFNQRSVSAAFDAISAAGATGDMQTQLATLFGLSASQAQAAYDSLSGTSLNYVHDAQLGFMDGFANIIGRHVEGGAGGGFAMAGTPVLLAAADTTASDVLPDYGIHPAANRGAWVQAYGSNGRTQSNGNAPAYDLSGGGLAIGIDRPLDNGWRVGAALAYGQQRFLTNAASGTTDGAAIAAYGHYTEGPWAVKLLASAGQTHNRSDRSVVLGATNRIASASFNGTQQSLYAESGYTMTMHELDVQPVAALAYTQLRNPAYTETGAGALNLNVAGQSRDSIRSYFGARLLKRAGDLRIEPRLIWVHQFGNIDSAELSASFAGSPANAFAVKGTDVSRDGAQLGLRMVKSLAKEQQSLYLDVSAEASNRRTNAALAAGMQLRW